MAIAYPVDVENTRWSVYRVSTQEILRHNVRWPRADGGPIERLETDLVPLLEVDAEQPAYDPATQRLVRSAPVVDVAANTHTHGWSIEARSQEEIDAEAELDVIRALYLDLKNGVGTAGERLTRVEKVVARMLKDQYAP